jgi:uncharacterized protein CbrC (UPF0167 family)
MLCRASQGLGAAIVGDQGIVAHSEYAGYPGSEAFEPWQDHEWPEHCGEPAAYLGEVGERELTAMSADVESFLREHDAAPTGEPITLDMVPPHAPKKGEAWDSTIHQFRCVACGWDLLLWDAN